MDYQRIFTSIIKPIYGRLGSGVDEHVGSCFFVEIKSKKYLISAAHVFDRRKEFSRFFVGMEDGCFPIVRGFFSSKIANGNRVNDKFDCAIYPLNDDEISGFKNILFLSGEKIMEESVNYKFEFAAIAGYPISKNKMRHSSVSPKEIKPNLHFLLTKLIKPTDSVIDELALDEKIHIFAEYKEKVHLKDGSVINIVNPTGKSGGLIIGIERCGEEFFGHVLPPRVIVGLIIEYHDKQSIVVAVNLKVIVRTIYEKGIVVPC